MCSNKYNWLSLTAGLNSFPLSQSPGCFKEQPQGSSCYCTSSYYDKCALIKVTFFVKQTSRDILNIFPVAQSRSLWRKNNLSCSLPPKKLCLPLKENENAEEFHYSDMSPFVSFIELRIFPVRILACDFEQTSSSKSPSEVFLKQNGKFWFHMKAVKRGNRFQSCLYPLDV